MWKERTEPLLGSVDETIVKEGFVYLESSSHFSFCDKDEPRNTFKRNLSVPTIQIFRVCENEPLRITSSGCGHVRVYPERESQLLEKIDKKARMPVQIWEDRSVWDMATLVLAPFPIKEKQAPQVVKDGRAQIIELEKKFFPLGHAPRDASLYFIPPRIGMGPVDKNYTFSFITPSQVTPHIFHWISRAHQISTYDGKEFIEDGSIKVGYERGRNVALGIGGHLEALWKTQLMHHGH